MTSRKLTDGEIAAINLEISMLLCRRMEAKGFTIDSLRKISGISGNQIRMILHAINGVNMGAFCVICKVLEVDINSLIGKIYQPDNYR